MRIQAVAVALYHSTISERPVIGSAGIRKFRHLAQYQKSSVVRNELVVICVCTGIKA